MKTKYFPLIVLVPVFAWFMIFFFYPIFESFRISLYEWNVIDPTGSPFVGFSNYAELWEDRNFIYSLRNTLIFVGVRVIIGIPLGLLVALLLERVSRFRNLFLAFIFAPYACSITSITILFRLLFQPRFGLFNFLLESIGLPPQRFYADPNQAIYVFAGVDIWQAMGYTVILYLAGLLEIPNEYIEAARIDGASGLQIFSKIKLPLLSNVTLFVFVTTFIYAFQVFERMAVMTGINQARPSQFVMAFFIYRYAIHHMRMGYACAASVIMFLLILSFTLLQLKILRRRWEY